MASQDVFPPYNLPDEAVPWGREVQKRVIAGEDSEVQLTQKVDNGLRATAGQLSALADQINGLSDVINALPVTITETSQFTGGGLTGSYTTVASVTIPAPTGKASASVTAIGNAAYLDTVTGGLTTSYMRILINGVVSLDFAASKDAGATQVNNVLSGTYSTRLLSPLGVTVDLQARGLNGSAFPPSFSNYANLTALVTFQ